MMNFGSDEDFGFNYNDTSFDEAFKPMCASPTALGEGHSLGENLALQGIPFHDNSLSVPIDDYQSEIPKISSPEDSNKQYETLAQASTSFQMEELSFDNPMGNGSNDFMENGEMQLMRGEMNVHGIPMMRDQQMQSQVEIRGDCPRLEGNQYIEMQFCEGSVPSSSSQMSTHQVMNRESEVHLMHMQKDSLPSGRNHPSPMNQGPHSQPSNQPMSQAARGRLSAGGSTTPTISPAVSQPGSGYKNRPIQPKATNGRKKVASQNTVGAVLAKANKLASEPVTAMGELRLSMEGLKMVELYTLELKELEQDTTRNNADRIRDLERKRAAIFYEALAAAAARKGEAAAAAAAVNAVVAAAQPSKVPQRQRSAPIKNTQPLQMPQMPSTSSAQYQQQPPDYTQQNGSVQAHLNQGRSVYKQRPPSRTSFVQMPVQAPTYTGRAQKGKSQAARAVKLQQNAQIQQQQQMQMQQQMQGHQDESGSSVMTVGQSLSMNHTLAVNSQLTVGQSVMAMVGRGSYKQHHYMKQQEVHHSSSASLAPRAVSHAPAAPPPPPPAPPIQRPPFSFAQCAKKIDERRQMRNVRLRDYMQRMGDELCRPQTELPFQNEEDALRRLLPYHSLHEPDLGDLVFEEMDTNFLRTMVDCDKRKENVEKRLQQIFLKEAVFPSNDESERNLLLFLDSEYERKRMEEEKVIARNNPEELLPTYDETAAALAFTGADPYEMLRDMPLPPSRMPLQYDWVGFVHRPGPLPTPSPPPSPHQQEPEAEEIECEPESSSLLADCLSPFLTEAPPEAVWPPRPPTPPPRPRTPHLPPPTPSMTAGSSSASAEASPAGLESSNEEEDTEESGEEEQMSPELEKTKPAEEKKEVIVSQELPASPPLEMTVTQTTIYAPVVLSPPSSNEKTKEVEEIRRPRTPLKTSHEQPSSPSKAEQQMKEKKKQTVTPLKIRLPPRKLCTKEETADQAHKPTMDKANGEMEEHRHKKHKHKKRKRKHAEIEDEGERERERLERKRQKKEEKERKKEKRRRKEEGKDKEKAKDKQRIVIRLTRPPEVPPPVQPVLPEEPSPVAIEKEEKEVVAPVPISPPTVAPLPLMKIPKIKIRLANPTSEERDSNKKEKKKRKRKSYHIAKEDNATEEKSNSHEKQSSQEKMNSSEENINSSPAEKADSVRAPFMLPTVRFLLPAAPLPITAAFQPAALPTKDSSSSTPPVVFSDSEDSDECDRLRSSSDSALVLCSVPSP